MPKPRSKRREKSVWTLVLGGVFRGVAVTVFIVAGWLARAAQEPVCIEEAYAPEIEVLLLFKRAAPDGWKMVRCETNVDHTLVETIYQEREQ